MRSALNRQPSVRMVRFLRLIQPRSQLPAQAKKGRPEASGRPHSSFYVVASAWRTSSPELLENDPQCQLSHSRVAVEHLVPLAEARLARDQVVANSGVILCVVDRADLSRSELRVVEGVGEVPTELQCLALTDGELFPQRQVEVIDADSLQRISAVSRQGPYLGLDVLRVAVLGGIADYIWLILYNPVS